MTEEKETFESFYKSFSYGSRSDLLFKFMSGLSESEADSFLKVLFSELINGIDDQNFKGIHRTILEWQRKSYQSPPKIVYESGPFSKMIKSVRESTIGLLSSSGQFVEGDDPKPFGEENMTQEEATKRIMDFLKATPELSHIPTDISPDEVKARHGGYDIRAAVKDPNTVLPYQRLNELAKNGTVGSAADTAFSFVGACSQIRLQKKCLPDWIEQIKQTKVDAMVLTPV